MIDVCACNIPDFAVLILREEKPSADSCGDLFLEKHTEGFLPVRCGAEAVFNFSWEKQILPFGSGDDDDDDDDTDYTPVTTVGATLIPTRALLSTASRDHTTQSSKAVEVDTVAVAPNRSVSRLPPRFTPSLENRHSSFQHLLRIHLNTFNQRLSMLEGNTLDMKESLRTMENQQSTLSSQLKELITTQSAGEKSKKVSELEKSYTDMEARLSRLEGRLEILIDGFTALAQEMNKMKRVRHVSRSPEERRVGPSLATVLAVPMYSTPPSVLRIIPTDAPLTSRATVPKSIPTPSLPVYKPTSAPQRTTKFKSAATTKPAVKNTTKLKSVTRPSRSQVSTRSAIKLKTTLGKPRTVSKSTSQAAVKAQTKRPEGRRSAAKAKHVPQPKQTKPKKVKEETTITKFQLEPPSHNSKPSRTSQLHKQPNQANKKKPASRIESNGRNKSFRSDAPVPKKLSKAPKGNSGRKEEKTEHNSHKTKKSAKKTVTTTKPTKTSTTKRPKTTVKRTTPAKIKAATSKKRSTTTVKRTSIPTKTKVTTVKKTTKKKQHKKKTESNSRALDLLRLLKGDYTSGRQKNNQDGSLHVVLGRLAIPIKIIPDD